MNAHVLQELREKLEKANGPDNALDIEIDIALFEPDEIYREVRPNAAGTKLVYVRRDGRTETYLAADHTLNPETKDRAFDLIALQALSTQEASK